MSQLFDTYTLRGVTLRNRIGVSPMCQYSSENGIANQWHLVHLGSRAVGGAALVIAEATAVEPRGRISPNDIGIWSDDHAAALAPIAAFIKDQGAVAGIQLAHAGRKAGTSRPWEGHHPLSNSEGGWDIIAPSAIPFSAGYRTPQAMTLEDIEQVKTAFRDATVRALDAGFKWIELHGAHGYLMHEFLSPIANTRTDEYGGSFDNRTRLLTETVRLMRAVCPDSIPLTVRFSCTDWIEDGWNGDDLVELARRLIGEGVDLIDCSSGGIAPQQKVPTGPGYQVQFAEAIRHETGMPTAAVGLVTEPTHADAIVRGEQADLVFLARELLRDPYWAIHAAQTLDQTAPVPPQYARAF